MAQGPTGHFGSGLGGSSFALSILHCPVPQWLSVPFSLTPKAMHLAASGPSEAGLGLTASHQPQHRSLGSRHGVGRRVRRGGARAGVLSSTSINSICPGRSPHTGGRGLVKELSQWGPAWHLLWSAHHGAVTVEGPQSTWPPPCSLLAGASSAAELEEASFHLWQSLFCSILVSKAGKSPRGTRGELRRHRPASPGTAITIPAVPVSPVLPAPGTVLSRHWPKHR